MLLGPLPAERTPGAVFDTGSNSAIATDPVDKATTLFTRYEQVEMNDFDLVDFWGIGPPYVDFHGYQVLEDCLENLKVVYRNHRDFM